MTREQLCSRGNTRTKRRNRIGICKECIPLMRVQVAVRVSGDYSGKSGSGNANAPTGSSGTVSTSALAVTNTINRQKARKRTICWKRRRVRQSNRVCALLLFVRVLKSRERSSGTVTGIAECVAKRGFIIIGNVKVY